METLKFEILKIQSKFGPEDVHLWQKELSILRTQHLDAEQFKNENTRFSAVLFLIYPKNDQWHFTLIKRNSYEGTHSAQVSLPGGKQEMNEILWQTSQRETFEEIGAKVLDQHFGGRLKTIYIPPSNFLVYPFWAIHNEELSLVPDEREVAQLLEIELKELKNAIIQMSEVDFGQGNRGVVPCYSFNDIVVWGATAVILREMQGYLKEIDF